MLFAFALPERNNVREEKFVLIYGLIKFQSKYGGEVPG